MQGIGLDLARMQARKGEVVGANVKGVEFLFRKNKVAWLKGEGRIAGGLRRALDGWRSLRQAPRLLPRLCRYMVLGSLIFAAWMYMSYRALGFEAVGLLRDSGWKFGRWLDVVVMQRALGHGLGHGLCGGIRTFHDGRRSRYSSRWCGCSPRSTCCLS